MRAHDQVDRTDHVVEHHQVQHGERQHKADRPGKSLLRGAHILRLLLAHDPLSQDQAGRMRGLMKMRMVKSIRKPTTNTRVG